MESKKEKLSQLFSIFSIVSVLLCLPFYFFGMFSVGEESTVFENIRSVSMTGLFNLASQDAENMPYHSFSAPAVLIIIAVVMILVVCATSFFKSKVMKIISFSLVCLVLILDIVICVLTLSAAGKKELGIDLSVGYGMILIFIFVVLAMAFSLVAMILSMGVRKTVNRVDGFVSYDIPMDIIGSENDTVLLGRATPYPAASANPMGATKGKISIVSGSCAGFTIPVGDGETIVIGKDPKQCAVVIDRKYTNVSRRHCEISYDSLDGAFIVKDCSANGVFLEDGTRLANRIMQRVPKNTMLTLAKTDNIIRLE